MIPFLLNAFLCGFFMAIPVGPANVEIVRRTTRKLIPAAFSLALGNSLADGFWAFVAFAGVAPFLEYPLTRIILYSVTALVTFGLGIMSLREYMKPRMVERLGMEVHSKRVSFLTGATLGLANPLMVVWWLALIGLFHSADIIPHTSINVGLLLGLGATAGALGYFGLVIYIVHRLHRFFLPKTLHLLSLIFGIVLLLLGVWALYHLYVVLTTMP